MKALGLHVLVLGVVLWFTGPTMAAGPAGHPPRSLDRLESRAEDAYDAALAGHTRRFDREIARARKAWAAYRPRAVKDGASDDVVAAVDTALSALAHVTPTKGRRVTAARAANAVSAQMAPLFALYHPRVPAPVMTLDYLGRELALDARMRDLKGAGAHLSRLQTAWTALRPKVTGRGAKGRRAALAYDRDLRLMAKALTAGHAPALRTAAERSLEDVDRIERAFGG